MPHQDNNAIFANEEMGEGDFGWDWLEEAWTVLFRNVCYISGIIYDEQQIVGKVELTQYVEGRIGCWS